MRTLIPLLPLLLLSTPSLAEIVTTTDGRQIELREDGSYRILNAATAQVFEPLDVEAFRVFPEVFLGKPVSASVTGALSRRDAERGLTIVDVGGKSSLWVRADISNLSQGDLVTLSGCQNCRYRLSGQVKKIGSAIGFEARKIEILDRN